MREFIPGQAFRMLMLAVSLAFLPVPASSADPRQNAPMVPAVQPHLSEGRPPDLVPPVPRPDKMPVTYECPRAKYIDCMPPLQGKAREMCAPEYLDWVEKNCPDVKIVY